MFHVGEEKGIELLSRELDEAGIDRIVMPGRYLADPPKAALRESGMTDINVDDRTLLDLIRRLNGRAVALHGIDVSNPKKATGRITRAVRDHGFPGAVLETGYSRKADGSPLHVDDRSLFPIYETILALDAVLMIQSGIYAGFDIGANDWAPLDRVLQDFPGIKILLAHGGYPRIHEAIALATKHPNLHVSPDIYTFFPGGKGYVEAIQMLPDQFLFGTAYPFGALDVSVDMTLSLPLEDDAMANYLSGNARRLFNL